MMFSARVVKTWDELKWSHMTFISKRVPDLSGNPPTDWVRKKSTGDVGEGFDCTLDKCLELPSSAGSET